MVRMYVRELRHRITFQKVTYSLNENGFEEKQVEPVKTVWASVSDLKAREYFAAKAVQEENTVTFTIRYTEGIDQKLQILFQDKAYNIIGVDHMAYRKRYLEIKALEA